MFIVTKKIDSENISKLCRTCLREDGDKMVYLFVGPAGSSLAAKLRSLSCLEVWQGDGLPEKMCDRCVTRAESALLYREQCRAADRALRQAALKVAGVTSYTTVSGCKLFQENQGFVPIQNCQKTLKCVECGAVFMNYQELLAHNKLHNPVYDENIPLHVFDSHMGYSSFTQQNYSTNTNFDHQNMSSLIKPKVLHSAPTNNIGLERNPCALHCSLINHSFPNKTPIVNHNYSQNSDNIDASCDEEQIEITDVNIFNRSHEQSCESHFRGTSYSGAHLNENEIIQNLRYPESIEYNTIYKNNINNSENHNHMSESNMLPKVMNNMDKNKILSSCKKAKERKYKCEQCSKSFVQKSKLRSHVLTHGDYKPFQCDKCNKAYASKSKLNAHVRLHSKINIHQCKICDKAFSYPSYLKEHSKVHDSKRNDRNAVKPFECSMCNKKFQVEKNLTTHLRLHTGKDLLNCEFCDKKFSLKYNLKAHLKMHQSAKVHKCEYCEKSFSQRSNLVEHIRIHTKKKPFTCELCGKCFSQSGHLKSHKTSHDNVRLFQCRICGKRFKLSSHLKRHMKLHSSRKIYKCNECDQLFSHAFSLKRHSMKHIE